MTREDLERLAAGIPPLIRFGTSSWTYPGWKGLVYHQDYGGKGTAAPMLAEYSRFPLFRTVGIDSSFYGPPTDAVLDSYAASLPPDFPCVSKVWQEITVHTWAKVQNKARAGEVNPHFLDQAAQLHSADMFDAAAVATLAQAPALHGIVAQYLPNLEKAVDNLARVLLTLWMQESDLKPQIGEQTFSGLEDNLQSTFKGLGDLVLRLSRGVQAVKEPDDHAS